MIILVERNLGVIFSQIGLKASVRGGGGGGGGSVEEVPPNLIFQQNPFYYIWITP